MHALEMSPLPQKISRRKGGASEGYPTSGGGGGERGEAGAAEGAPSQAPVHATALCTLLHASPFAAGFMHRCAPLAHSWPGEAELH